TVPGFIFIGVGHPPAPHSFPTRRSSDLQQLAAEERGPHLHVVPDEEVQPVELGADHHARLSIRFHHGRGAVRHARAGWNRMERRSEEHTSELQSLAYLVCRLLLEKKTTQ